MNEQEHQQPAETNERLQPEVPRIYVASLSDYNAGRLHGTWIDLDDDTESMWTRVRTMLADSPEPSAEEWAIHDYENFGPLRLGEWENLDLVHAVAAGIIEHGEAFAAWADHLNRSEWADELSQFAEHFCGTWESPEAFAEQLLDDLGEDIDHLGPDHLQPYLQFDLEAFARDLLMDYRTTEGKEGLHVFDY